MKRKIASIIFILLSVWFMLPLFKGVLHIGMIYPVLIFLFLAAVLAFWDRVNVFFKKHKIVFCALFAAFVVGITAIVLPLGFMIAASVDTPPENATVIVLGCQVKGDKPSTMLRDRCRSALNFLNANPNSVCVASGGQGNGENISEAKAIFNFLTENGISPERIYLDEKSTNTSENLSFSADIIKENGLATDVAIASDNFHQLRAEIFAKKNGLTAYSAGNPTYLFVAPGYWAREILAVYKAVILGY